MFILSDGFCPGLKICNHLDRRAQAKWKTICEALNIKNLILSPVKLSAYYIPFNSVYAICYIIIILGFTIFVFNKKTFEN